MYTKPPLSFLLFLSANTSACGDLTKNGSHKLLYLNLSPHGVAVFEKDQKAWPGWRKYITEGGLGGLKKPTTVPVFLSLSLSLFISFSLSPSPPLSADQDVVLSCCSNTMSTTMFWPCPCHENKGLILEL